MCDKHGIVLTGRAENHLYRAGDIDDTIARLVAYREAGATCLYAPGLTGLADITRVVADTGAPVNVLALRHGPTVAELAGAGVRRVSTGGGLAWAAYGAMVRAATELRDAGTATYRTGRHRRHYRINDNCIRCFPSAADVVMGNPAPTPIDACS